MRQQEGAKAPTAADKQMFRIVSAMDPARKTFGETPRLRISGARVMNVSASHGGTMPAVTPISVASPTIAITVKRW